MPYNPAAAECAPVPALPALDLFELKQEYLGGQPGRPLTSLEETGLSGIIHAGRQAADVLAASEPLTPKAKGALEHTAGRGRDAFDVFFSANRRLVKDLAVGVMTDVPETIDPDDLIQVGYIELSERILQFDPTTELSFFEYAAPYVRGNMVGYVEAESARPHPDDMAYGAADDDDSPEVDPLDIPDGPPWVEDSIVGRHEAKLAVTAIILLLRRIAKSRHAGGKDADADRSFKILVARRVEGRSLTEIATDHRISQARVQQIIRQTEIAVKNRLSAEDQQNIFALGYGTIAQRRQLQWDER